MGDNSREYQRTFWSSVNEKNTSLVMISACEGLDDAGLSQVVSDADDSDLQKRTVCGGSEILDFEDGDSTDTEDEGLRVGIWPSCGIESQEGKQEDGQCSSTYSSSLDGEVTEDEEYGGKMDIAQERQEARSILANVEEEEQQATKKMRAPTHALPTYLEEVNCPRVMSKKEKLMEEARIVLRRARAENRMLIFQDQNPKSRGSKSAYRYDKYHAATSFHAFDALCKNKIQFETKDGTMIFIQGATQADLLNDLYHGYLMIGDKPAPVSVDEMRKRPHEERTCAQALENSFHRANEIIRH